MRIVALISCLSVLSLAAEDVDPDVELAELRQLISEIVAVKSQDSAEKTGWASSKAEMAALLDLQRQELSLLTEELEEAGQSAGGYDARKKEAEADLVALKAARRVAGETVVGQRDRMLALAKRFPLPLRKDCEVELLQLEEWKNGDEPREGLQSILGMVTKAEQFNRRITRSKEQRDGREVEVIYLGLARAYYADRSGNAGVGVPGRDGWVWSRQESINSEVVKALDELDKKRPPELVRLPVKIEEVAP